MKSAKGWKRASAAGIALAVLMTGGEWMLGQPGAVQVATAATTGTVSSTLVSTIQQKLNEGSASFAVQVSGSASASVKTVDQAFETAMKLDDYVNYTIKSYSYSSKSDGKTATVSVKVDYWENATQSAYVAKRSKEIRAEIIKPGMNAHQKVKAVHDWILLNVTYDRSLRKHSAYDALASGTAVCQGYASLAYRLLKDAGVEVRIAEGTVSTGAHAWNLVKLDGQWYHLDTTFDDPVPDVKGRTTYSYYLLTDAQIKRDHKWTIAYPAAVASYQQTLKSLKTKDTSRQAFYANLEETLGYKYLLPAYSASTVEDFASKIKAAIKAGQSLVKVRYVNGANKKLDLQKLLDAVPALTSIQTSSSSFPIGNADDALVTITFKT
ncbi:transglutaminase domain-containing protein [Cohnella thailandensis]|uniref:Transglutaminase n=1 Tax=Cohnella thailandensis TaxID=557557 RepID=A0A841T8K5_9BACL|nr:transglutaminase domain-containing protein [Cohnella thailandensis]MBB6638187.1 transglutaminase [Cohnella thailandensis]MBP1977821.1 transglutaminase-like putative cysteine protease [Cohnella thailandensis]